MRRIHLILSFLFCIFFTNVSLASQDEKELELASLEVRNLLKSYTAHLFPHHDPFLRIFDLEAGKALFERMSLRKISKDSWTQSPLSKVSFALKHFVASEKSLDRVLVDEVIADASNLLTLKRVEQIELQSNLLALHFLSHYLQRFETIQKSENSEDQGSEDQGSEKKKDEGKKEEKKEQEKKDPKYPDTPDKYKPRTKDAKKEKGSKEDQFIVAEANFETPYFGQRFFSEIVRGASHPFQEASLPGVFAKPAQAKDVKTHMIVRTFGKKQVRLFLPPSYRPLQPTDPRVQILRTASGSYDIKMDEILEEVLVPMSDSTNEFLQAPILDIHTRPVGFKLEEWPSLVRSSLFQLYNPEQDHTKSTLNLAQAIAAHIATNYLYSVGERPETDPIKALEAGAFQCDMAAFAMVGLLRDVYQIPSRVVGGFRAKKHGSGADRKSYLVMPGDAHAWVEVYSNGRWVPFDPTPVKKDKKEDKDEDEEKNEYSDRNLENPLIPPPESEASDLKANKTEDPSKLSKEDQLKKDSEDRLKEVGGNSTSNGTHPVKDPNLEMDLDELASKLEIGSLELDPQPDRNPLRERVIRVLLSLVLDPNNTGLETLDLLNKAKSVLRGVRDPKVTSLYTDALRIHENAHDKLETWIKSTNMNMKTRDLAASYKDLYKARKATGFFASTLDKESDRVLAAKLISTLDAVLSDIYALSHTDSKEISSVLAFYNYLPTLVQQYLQTQYNLKSVGANAPTKELAHQLRAGNMNDLRLLASLYPVTDFIMNSTPRPEYQQVLTWQRDLRRPSGRDLMPLQRFGELHRALFLQHARSIEQNIQDNTAYVMTNRKRMFVPSGFGIDEAEKITIVLYDISGSMSGDPAHFQSGLISAFTARALSEVSPSGKHNHRILLIPFDDKPGEATRVTNTQEAFDVIHNYRAKLAKSQGGTNIQKAMIQALALIADAEKRAGEPLAAANIVLMTDGQSDIDLEELAQARNAIDRGTPVQSMFIAIGSTNDQLIKFAMDSRSAGFDHGFYSEFTNELMAQYLQESKSTELKIDHSVLYTEHKASDLSRRTFDLLDEASRDAFTLSERARDINSISKTPKDHLRDLEALRWDNSTNERELSVWIEGLRKLSKSVIFKNKKIMEKICDDLVSHIEAVTRIPFSEYVAVEMEQIRHFVREADRP